MSIDTGTTFEAVKKEFNDLPTPARMGISVATVLELGAKIATWVDLGRRPAAQVRGPKWVWALAQLVNGIGPAAYWLFGRK